MKDRNVQYPYRFHVRPVAGTDDICEIIPAPGTIYEDGTFWNKQNVLKDDTAALYGKTAAAVPDEIFAAIRPLISNVQNAVNIKGNVSFGSYVGNGKFGANSPNRLTFPFSPRIVIIPQSDRNFFTMGDYVWILALDLIGTSYSSGKGFGYRYGSITPYGKKSTDGKTLYWYTSAKDSADAQFNTNQVTYFYAAIG